MVAGTHQGPTAAENGRLLAQNAALLNLLASNQAELASARAELAACRVELREQAAVANTRVGELTARIDDLMQELAKQADRITELLVIARRKKNPKKPPTEPKPAEPPPTLDEAARAAFEDRPQPPVLRGALNDRPRPKQRPTGRKPLPAHLPVDESTVHPERCPCGCDAFDWVDEVVEDKLHVVAQHQRVRRTRRKTGRCRACGKRTTAQAPPSPFARSKVSCPWLAWFIVQKFALLTPLDRLRRFLALQGVPLSKSFFVLQTAMAADLLAAIDGEQWKSLLARDHLASDATGYKVQIRGYGLHHGHMEVYHWGDVVVFQYTAEKGGETQAAKLASFVGTLLVDAEPVQPNGREPRHHRGELPRASASQAEGRRGRAAGACGRRRRLPERHVRRRGGSEGAGPRRRRPPRLASGQDQAHHGALPDVDGRRRAHPR